ncbi:tetraspanin-9-like isoform X2 [Corticium candelabrum]|uniref:tetraspanin-9-like isoform X2 n=1 Tax=Corticium candelabrum TaxID=121492 RepID=UPI002E2F8B83|nr:tetraspanin-9-like isoform X2 [Corticium candelabrum]
MIFVICFGGVMFLNGFLGCCGTLNENKCILKMFCCLTILLILGEIGLSLVVWLLQDDIESYKQKMWRGFGDPIRIYLQTELDCCAYLHSNVQIEHERKFKSFQHGSCYRDNLVRSNDLALNVSLSDIIKPACQEAITRWLTDHRAVLSVAGSLFICLQIVAIMYVCFFLCSDDSSSLNSADQPLPQRKKHPNFGLVNNRVVPLELEDFDDSGHRYNLHQTTDEQLALQRRPVPRSES